MIVIVLDTNIWISLASFKHYELLEEVRKIGYNDDAKLVITDIIKQEWARNKDTTLKHLCNQIESDYALSKNITQYLPSDKVQPYLEIVRSLSDKDWQLELAKNRVEEIEQIMNVVDCVQHTQEQELYVSNLAINNLPPFQKHKNNFNDALILRSVAEYVDEDSMAYESFVFVTENKDDFYDKDGRIFPDLIKGLSVRVENANDIPMAKHLLSRLEEEMEDEYISYLIDAEAQDMIDELLLRKACIKVPQ